MLSIRNLHVHFGQAHILQGVSLEIGLEPIALIGRNGMGKTTLCKTIMGMVRPSAGDIRLMGRRSVNCLFTKSAIRASLSFRRGGVYFPRSMSMNICAWSPEAKMSSGQSSVSMRLSRALPNARKTTEQNCLVVNSRCRQLPVRCCSIPDSLSWMNLPKGWLLSSSIT